MSFRLRYVAGSDAAIRFPHTRYPQTWNPPYPTRERAELVREAMPWPERWEIEESED